MTGKLVVGGALLLMLVSFPAWAESPSATVNLQAIFSVLPDQGTGACTPPATVKSANSEALGDCTARCQDGSTLTCTGSSCSAVDASCPSESGYCWGSTTGTRACPACTGGCICQQGAQCLDDTDCDCNQGLGFCAKEPGGISGTCSCY